MYLNKKQCFLLSFTSLLRYNISLLKNAFVNVIKNLRANQSYIGMSDYGINVSIMTLTKCYEILLTMLIRKRALDVLD